MAKRNKSKEIGSVSFTSEGYENFVTLSKEEQVKYIADGLSPKDPEYAEKLLKNIPHGTGISKGDGRKYKKADSSNTGGNKKDNPA